MALKLTKLSSSGSRKILLIYTGGTIGMARDLVHDSLKPFPFQNLLKSIPKIADLGYQISYCEFEEPIDSSNITGEDWQEIARTIYDNYHDFDGFVILHGTDTMAYTASALSFMLQNLCKPVVLTGSQLPLGDIREDGTENLITAIQVAAAERNGEPIVQEVVISFGRDLLRGNRTTKVSSKDFGAFTSYNYTPLARISTEIDYYDKLLLRGDKSKDLAFYPEMDSSVGIIWLYPGMSDLRFLSLCEFMERPFMKGIILRTFGAGNAPTRRWVNEALKSATEHDAVIVNVTQCASGGVEDKRYETGKQLAELGVISGEDITCEAALAKMMHLFGRGLDPQEVRDAMQVSLVGEMRQTAIKGS